MEAITGVAESLISRQPRHLGRFGRKWPIISTNEDFQAHFSHLKAATMSKNRAAKVPQN
jgi:hypothetical protein